MTDHSPFCGCAECVPRSPPAGRYGSPTVAKAGGDHAFETIVAAVADVYGLTPADIKGRDRHRSIAEARKLAAWFAYKLTPMSYPEVGRALGDRDHTTVINAAKGIERRLQTDHVLHSTAERVLALLEGEPERRTA